MSRKGNKADLAPSRRERKGIGQYILGFFLLLYIYIVLWITYCAGIHRSIHR